MATDERQREWASRLQAALAARDEMRLREVLDEMHAADLAEIFPDLEEEERLAVLDALSDEQAATLLDELDVEDQAETLDLIPVERASDILEEMPSDEAADLLAELPREEADALLERMEPESADDVAELMRYPEDTAGGLMAKEFVHISPGHTVADVLEKLRVHHDDAEMIYYLYVLDDEERLLGIVSLRDLIVSDPAVPVAQVMRREFISASIDLPQEGVAELVRRHGLLAIPVIDAGGRMHGIVTVDDVGDVVQEEAAEELLETSGSEPVEEAPGTHPRLRGWRTGMLALAGGLLSAGMIGVFAGTLIDWGQVALLLPLLLILGITAGNQAAISVDQACEDAAERHLVGRIIAREVLAGVLLAMLGGVLAAALLLALYGNMRTAVATAVPLALGLWTAAITGALGVMVHRWYSDRLGSAAHTLIVVAAILVAISVYLLTASWLAGMML